MIGEKGERVIIFVQSALIVLGIASTMLSEAGMVG